MKTQTCGTSNEIFVYGMSIWPTPRFTERTQQLARCILWAKPEKLRKAMGDSDAAEQSLLAYYCSRENGLTIDHPPHELPFDGSLAWTTPGASSSTVTYTEGPKDRAWMEEMDRNYIARLAHEGILLEKEPNVLAEIRPDHAYRQEIAQAIYLARFHMDGNSLIVFDALQHQYDLVADVLCQDEKLDSNICRNGISILLDSLQRQSMIRIKALVARGADVNFKDPSGKTILQIAVMKKEWEIVKVLLCSNKLDLASITHEAQQALHHIAKTGDLELAKKLLKHGADINAQDADEKTALHHAILSQQPAMVDCLLAHADIQLDAISVEHCTALHYAAQLGDRDTVAKLIAKNANVLIKDGMNKTARDYAIAANHTAVAGLLLRAESTTSATHSTGTSSLSSAPSVTPSLASPITLTAKFVIPFNQLEYGLELGVGGFGRVYRGRWKMSEVAIKELHCQEMSQNILEQFQSEAELMYNLRHDRVIQMKGICLESGHMSMVMELMPRGSLYSVLHNGSVALPWQLRWEISMDIAHGLAYLHSENILHRDLKSLNVLLDGNMRAKISDFGLSAVKVETRTKTGTASEVGTNRWKAPEIMAMKPKYSEYSDVFAFAMVLWEIAARALPYTEADEFEIREGVKSGEREDRPDNTPLPFWKIIETCWAQKPEKRPRMQQVFSEFESLHKQGIFARSGAEEALDVQVAASLFSEQFSAV